MHAKIWFSDLNIICPAANSLVRSAITFQRSTTAINLSRAYPTEVSVSRLPYQQPRYGSRRFITHLGRPAVLVSTGAVRMCQLVNPMRTSRIVVKRITLALFFQESERLHATLAMVFGNPSLSADTIEEGFVARTNILRALERSRLHVMTSNVHLLEATDEGTQYQTYTCALGLTVSGVPIYDARNHLNFGLDQDLSLLNDVLPRFRQDLAPGSIVTVGYTPIATEYKPQGEPKDTFTPHVQWVILWALGENPSGPLW
ncbi:hypothetical protein BJ165DRAFT_1524614 [Panaeolus papilionaceus]|nr:hypothetical protein BJ165DRAFT_1524614 [Panaeolus papilionaceus]